MNPLPNGHIQVFCIGTYITNYLTSQVVATDFGASLNMQGILFRFSL